MPDTEKAALMSWEQARADSIEAITQYFLSHPETGKPLVLLEVFDSEEDVSVNLVCVDDLRAETAIIHKVYTGIAEKSDGTPPVQAPEAKIIQFPQGLVDLNGNRI